ncbi:secreted RxLR effector protein 161-like [Chrysoperla carnea]|uniref:secreted RxLR effector protein 161-like n=1 Tax=Chrysoperla carnea TaxID=189513 RepID=UPI001D099154|nr:secreted RxLR effector protein 161-like [Chrysoperla carnea]
MKYPPPMELGMITSQENYINDKPLEKSKPYREAIGSLLYLAIISRPDISFAVNYLSRYNSKPMKTHWKMIKRIFAYLKGTIKFRISFNGSSQLIAYTDSDYGGDVNTGHSTSGVLIMRGGPIVWYSQKQRLVATSTAEAEYRAAVSSIDDVCWLRRIGKELNILEIEEPTTLFIDNQSAIHMLKNMSDGKITKGKKHIDISRKFIQEHIEKTVKLKHVKSSDQLADILTKPLARKIFQNLRSKIIMEEC